MLNAWEFPTSLCVGGKNYEIRTDYRAVLDLMTALNDPEIKDDNEQIEAYIKSRIILEIMFPQYDSIPDEYMQEAIDKACEFIDMGIADGKNKIKVMDWQQDAPILIPAINKVLNTEIRESKHIHWWTFLGAYMEIGESLFSNIVQIRMKKSKGKKLEKWELDFYKENKSLIDFTQPNQARSDEEKEMLRNYFGYKK